MVYLSGTDCWLHTVKRQVARLSLGSFSVVRFDSRTSGCISPFRAFSNSHKAGSSPADCDIIQGPSLLRTAAVHRPRPSLLFLPGLRSLPFWTQFDGETNRVAYQDAQIQHVVTHLEAHVATFQAEYGKAKESQLSSDYSTETEHHSLHEGTWDWHSYMTKGIPCSPDSPFSKHFPETSKVLQQLEKDMMLFTGTPFGYAFFSTLHPQSKIAAHCAPMNLRLRVHVPLQVPAEPIGVQERPSCGIRVGPTTRTWQEGRAFVLDDAYEHEVWNETDTERVLLLVDVWHPDVTLQERASIERLFLHAREQGWWSTTGERSSS